MVEVHAENPQSQRQLYRQAIIAAVEAAQQRRQIVGLVDFDGRGQCPTRQAPQVGGERWKEGPQSGHPAAMLGPHSGENGHGLLVR